MCISVLPLARVSMFRLFCQTLNVSSILLDTQHVFHPAQLFAYLHNITICVSFHSNWLSAYLLILKNIPCSYLLARLSMCLSSCLKFCMISILPDSTGLCILTYYPRIFETFLNPHVSSTPFRLSTYLLILCDSPLVSSTSVPEYIYIQSWGDGSLCLDTFLTLHLSSNPFWLSTYLLILSDYPSVF